MHPTVVHGLIRHIFAWLIAAGVFGPFLLGIADSSFLFLPLGNDLLVMVLAARDHTHLPFYVVSAALGSMSGVFLLDLVCRTGGAQGLRGMLSPRRLEYFKRKMADRAGIAIGVASLAPPPFPFTLVVASASAFGYPRPRLLGLVLAARALRFTILGLLAIRFGRHILRIAQAPATAWVMLGFIVLCAIGSGFQIMQWISRSRQPDRRRHPIRPVAGVR